MDKGVEKKDDINKNSDSEDDGSASLSTQSEEKQNEESSNVDAGANVLCEKSAVILTLLYSFLSYLLR